jgi:hypothetical protein
MRLSLFRTDVAGSRLAARRRPLSRVLIAAALVASGVAVAGQAPAVANGCPTAVAYDSSGKGDSAVNPIEIQTTAHLLHLAATSGDWGKHFKQTADLNLAGCTWSPIGGSSQFVNANGSSIGFLGSYDGGGFSITGLTANYADGTPKSEVGMFGFVGVGGVIRGVNLVNVSVSGRNKVGALAGHLLRGTVENSTVSGTVSATGVSTGAEVGGLVGYLEDASIATASAVVEVTGVGKYVGGLVGYGDGTIANSAATGNVTGSAQVGGLVGEIVNNNPSSVSDSYATGTVTAVGIQAGGLAGAANGPVTRSYATGDVHSTSNQVGGLVGVSGATITESYATGTVSGVSRVGGLAGDAGNAVIERSFATGNVQGQALIGGLVGLSNTIEDSFARGNVIINAIGSGSNAGGLVGERNSATISRSYATGQVVSTGIASSLGGLDGSTFGRTTVASFWDVSTSALTDGFTGTGLDTDEMKALTTFAADGVDWDIDALDGDEPVARTTVWGLSCNVNDGYPHLVWFYASGYPTYPLTAPCTSPDEGSSQTDNNNGGSTGGVIETVVPAPEPTPEPTPEPEVTTPAPVQVNEALPQMAPGEVVVYEDGVPISVQVFVEDDTELVIEASSFELRLAGECDSGCTVEETDEGRYLLTLEENGVARTDGSGFQPGSQVDVWLFSTPTYLGQLTVNADGRFSGLMELGDIEVGEHTLQVNGLSVSGSQRSANIGVLVNSVENAVPTTLPAAGFETVTMPWVLLMLATGGLLVLTSRRTRRI